MQALCQSMTGLRLAAPRVARPVAAAKSLASKANGISAAPKLQMIARQQQQQPVAALGLEILCADGRRGGKLKTRKSAAKRFRITGTGKIMARNAGKNHFQEKKGGKRRSRLTNAKAVSETHKDLITRCLPYAGIR